MTVIKTHQPEIILMHLETINHSLHAVALIAAVAERHRHDIEVGDRQEAISGH